MNCVIYARVSSKEQEREGFSIPAQQKLLRSYASEHDLTIVKEFEEAETAKTSGRPEFNAMLEFLRDARNGCKTILVEKTDRLYRNIKDWVVIDELGFEIHFVKEGEIVSNSVHSSRKFLHGIRVLMAKQYIDNLSEEVKKGLNERAAEGEWPSKAPVGYLNNKETHTIEPDPEKGPFIVKLFELYASGNYSVDRLSKMARESGLFSRNSMVINKAGINRILRNPIYYGEFLWKGKHCAGTHQNLISKRLFEDVQAAFARANRSKGTKRNFAFADS